MKTYRAVVILKKLSITERNDLEEYLALSSSRCRPQVFELLSILIQHIDNIPDSKAAIHNLTGNSLKRLDDLTNKLLAHIEDFCARQSLLKETSAVNFNRHLLAFYSERGLSDLFEPCYKRVDKQLKKVEPDFSVEHLDMYNYYTDLAIHDKIHKGRKLSIQLSEYAPHLDVFYYSEKLKVICENLNRKNISNTSTSYLKDAQMIFRLAGGYAKKYPIIEMYLTIAAFLKTGEVTTGKFDKLYAYIISIPVSWPSYTEIISLCHYLINMCLRGIKNGNQHFQKRFIDLIIFMELKGLLLERETISAPIFSAIVRIGLKEKGVLWTESFFRKYVSFLPPESKEEIIAFTEALILFYQKKYSLAEERLNSIETAVVDIYYKMNIHKLQIKILMEENIGQSHFDISLVDKKLRNFGLFLTTNKSIGNPNKQELQNFNLYVKRIAANYGIKARRNAVLAKLMKETQVAEKEWLLSLFIKNA
jgi:hypothetical protein